MMYLVPQSPCGPYPRSMAPSDRSLAESVGPIAAAGGPVTLHCRRSRRRHEGQARIANGCALARADRHGFHPDSRDPLLSWSLARSRVNIPSWIGEGLTSGCTGNDDCTRGSVP